MKDVYSIPSGSFLARSPAGARNGSVLRKTHRKNQFAQYINGDFIGFISAAEIPENEFNHYLTRAEARHVLPFCFFL